MKRGGGQRGGARDRELSRRCMRGGGHDRAAEKVDACVDELGL